MNNIPPLDLTKQYETIGEEVNAAVLKVLASGRYIGGPVVQSFEQQFANYIGVSESVSCNSGTDSLYLALRSLNIGPGDEVITTPFTFIATAEVISAVGATPVFVDIDAKTFNLDVNLIEAAINSRTKAIIPVHLFGQPAPMLEIMAIAEKYGLMVIEDCAQAAGAQWHGKRVGSIGHIGCFSFFPTKNLGAFGDGGACTTSLPEIAANMRMLKEHGSRKRYHHEVTGINSRLDVIQAAILQIKLRYLDFWNEGRAKVAARYHNLLSPLPGLILPQEPTGGKGVWNQYTIRVISQEDKCKFNYRDVVRDKLQEKGVMAMVYYPLALHLQEVYQNLGYVSGQLPIAEAAANQVLSLPMFPELTEEQQEQVVYSLKDCLTEVLE